MVSIPNGSRQGIKAGENSVYDLFDSKVIFVCSSERCTSRGSGEIYDFIKQLLEDRGLRDEIGLEWSRCMRLCDLGPSVLVFPDGEVYSHMTMEKAEQIVSDLAVRE